MLKRLILLVVVVACTASFSDTARIVAADGPDADRRQPTEFIQGEAALVDDPSPPPAARSLTIPPGEDCWQTPAGATSDFVVLPANFLTSLGGEGSDPFAAVVQFEGVPLNNAFNSIGLTDTIVRRLAPAVGGLCGDSTTIPIEIVALSLKSTNPITVTYPNSVELWDLQVCLPPNPPTAQPIGSMTINHECPDGGSYTVNDLPVQPRFIFTRQGGGPVSPVIRDATSPLNFTSAGWWSHTNLFGLVETLAETVDADCDGAVETNVASSGDFFPGLFSPNCLSCSQGPASFQKPLTLEQALLAAHGVFVANQDKPLQVGACCLPDGSCIITGSTLCPGVYLGNGTACAGDADGDGVDDACPNAQVSYCCDANGLCYVTAGSCAVGDTPVPVCLGDNDGDGKDDVCPLGPPGCGDGNCDPLAGENPCTCPADCGPSPATETGADCADGIDNDCDGPIDCFDSDCILDPVCGWFFKDYNDAAPLGFMPDYDQNKDYDGDGVADLNYCGPTAVGNSIWWFHHKFPNEGIVPAGVDKVGLIQDLAQRMATNEQTPSPNGHVGPYDGTYQDDMQSGIADYLAANGVDDLLYEHTEFQPDFNFIASEVQRSQDVVLLLGFYHIETVTEDPPGSGQFTVTWRRVGGHYVTVAGVNKNTNSIAVSDPDDDAAELGGAGVVRGGPDHDHDGDGNAGTTMPFRNAGYDHLKHNDKGLASHDMYALRPSFSPGGVEALVALGDPLRYAGDISDAESMASVHQGDAGGDFDVTDPTSVDADFLTQIGYPPPIPCQTYTEIEYAIMVSPKRACCQPGLTPSCFDVITAADEALCLSNGGTLLLPGTMCSGLDVDLNGIDDTCDPPICGDGVCDGANGEDQCTCPIDCGTPPATEVPNSTCQDGTDNDCDGATDCDDPDCAGDPACPICEPNAVKSACNNVTCPVPPVDNECRPKCINLDPTTGNFTVEACECKPLDDCYVDLGAGGASRGFPVACVQPDASGTVVLPPAGCPYVSPEDFHIIIDSLDPGTTVEIGTSHEKFLLRSSGAGGIFPGGEFEEFDGLLIMDMQGTGAASAFSRVAEQLSVLCEVNIGPRNPGDAVQDFDTEMVQLQGELFGDPDFCTFRVRAGRNFGLPSPGHTTLIRQGPAGSDFSVDSFFDVFYEIEWQGCPGGALNGLGGTTYGTVRMATGATLPPCTQTCPANQVCEQVTSILPDGSLDMCCECVTPPAIGACCIPDALGNPSGCIVTTQTDCTNHGGSYQGNGTVCGGVAACCLPDGTCTLADRLCCQNEMSGTAQSAGSTCVDTDGGGTADVCEVPEACCFLDGSCSDITPSQCASLGGLPGGFGSACAGVDLDNNGIDDACDCEIAPDQLDCDPSVCPSVGAVVQECAPRCINFNQATGTYTVIACDCREDACQVQLPAIPGLRTSHAPCDVVEDPANPGTIKLPPDGCEYLSPEEVHAVIDNNPGATIELATIHKDFICQKLCGGDPAAPACQEAGGVFGPAGEIECFDSTLAMELTGTGLLSGYNRTLNLGPTRCLVHTAPRNPGDAVQDFDNEMVQLLGEIVPGDGDPDFDSLRIIAGRDFGLPSPGHTTLVLQPGGTYQVDSFFDIVYEIDFVGAPGGALNGFGGTSQGTIRMQTGNPIPPCLPNQCDPGETCVRTLTPLADGTVDVCCDCVPDQVCDIAPGGGSCLPITCPNPAIEDCTPSSVRIDNVTGQVVEILACDCREAGLCGVVINSDSTASCAGTCPVATPFCKSLIQDQGDGTSTLECFCASATCTCGDINQSGGPVNLADFAAFALCFGKGNPGGACDPKVFFCSDQDGGGTVNLVDFAKFQLVFGKNSTNTPPNCP